jgi:hypothetical protein
MKPNLKTDVERGWSHYIPNKIGNRIKCRNDLGILNMILNEERKK